MFAILQRSMESSSVGRLSPNISPPLQTSSPPPLIAFVKTEKEDPQRGSPFKPPIPVKRERGAEELGKSDAAGLAPKDDATDSQMLKQRLEMYWQGMRKYQQQMQEQEELLEAASDGPEDVMEKAKNVVQRLIEDDLGSVPESQRMPWPSLASIPPKQTNHSSANGSSQSLLSQGALATMLSLQHMQQQNATAEMGSLLPPPPELVPAGLPVPTTSNPFPQPFSSTVVDAKSIPTTSEKPTSGSPLDLSHDSIRAPTTSQSKIVATNFDLPLDLSMPSAGKKRPHDYVPKSTSSEPKANRPPPLIASTEIERRKKMTDASLASIQSNFPTLLNNRAQARAAQRAAVAAHIQNGLTSDSIQGTAGPFTSLYQKQEEPPTTVPNCASVQDLIQGGVAPLQIQQWLLAAVSAQKMQQMALSQISLLQQQRHQVANEPVPPKKRQKMNDGPRVQVTQSLLPQVSVSQQASQPSSMFSRSQNSKGSDVQFTPGRPNGFSSTNSRSPKAASPTLSPDSTQSQSGKRYRRYAKPPYSYVSLITLSILSSREKKLRLSQILKRISEMFPFFNGSYQGWRDSVRHNLSQNECFVKVLKNPYRPTAKGNFWTVNLNSIPHELLLRQNTLVSRYAQDSGYRYRKDLSEVFDLRTGALKVPVPRHLLRETGDPNASVLSDDPAAVMEAILLEETSDDETTDFKDKITPDVRQFTLEDLFCQNEDGEEDSSLSSGRNRARNKPSSHTTPLSQPPTLLPRSYASAALYQPSAQSVVNGLHASLHNRALEAQNLAAMGMLPRVLLSQGTNQSAQIPLALSNAAPNPFAAAQTALLSKALAATQFTGFDGLPTLQKMFYPNQTPQKQNFETPTTHTKTPTPVPTSITNVISPIPKTSSPNSIHHKEQDENNQSQISDHSSVSKRNKRKGVQPVRHAGDDNSQADSSLSPRNSFSVPASGTSGTPSRTLSSEADSASTNQFCSPVTSSKSQSSSSPRHDESSEFEDNRQLSQNIYEGQATNGISSFQALQLYGASSLQASKMA